MILMKNLILILIFAAVGLNTMASNPVHVIITAGQSNTDGRTPNEDLPAYIKALATDTLTYAEGAYRYCQIASDLRMTERENLFLSGLVPNVAEKIICGLLMQ